MLERYWSRIPATLVYSLGSFPGHQCIHRDLKGENLLITSNGRLKITDFGFARIAAQNAEESKRLTFCGTDSYMSPEISQGEQFGLETDIFSLGVIFCEVLARKLADDYTFKVSPSYRPPYGQRLTVLKSGLLLRSELTHRKSNDWLRKDVHPIS
jgi:serine/threonine protein kinase